MGIDTVLIPAFGFWIPLCLYPIGCIIIYYLSGYYLKPYNKRLGKEFLSTFGSSVLIALGAFFLIIIDDHVEHYASYLVSLFVLFGLQFVLSYLPRLAITLHSRLEKEEEPSIVIEQTEDMSEHALYQAIAQAYPTGKQIYVVPRLFDIVVGAAHIDELNKNPYICITEVRMRDSEVCIKRALDIYLSILVLVILSPVYIIISLIIKATSQGPILYSQERIGMYGRPFRILKFRTMEEGSEGPVPQLAEDNDPRITTIGHFLRKYRLDELPQFINILRGEMSIVGPRPERPYFIKKIEEQAPYYCLLYKIRPGLTSWGPIKVGYTDTIEKMVERLRYDIAYTENMSITLDIKILLRTIGVIADGKGK